MELVTKRDTEDAEQLGIRCLKTRPPFGMEWAEWESFLQQAAQAIADGRRPMPLVWDHNANRHYEPVEMRAIQIYASFKYDGRGTKPAWTPHGNGLKQDEARSLARSELRAAGHQPAPSCA